MKRKISLINGIIIFISLTLFLIISIFIISKNYYYLQEKEIKNDILLIKDIYNGNNEEEIIQAFKKSHTDLRITFISYDGIVIKDSSDVVEFESHLERPEILDLGNVYTRYSTTLNKYMMYISHKDDGVYIRVAIPVKSVNPIVNSFLILWIFILLSIFLLSVILINIANKKALAPLNAEINKLSRLAGFKSYYGDDIERLSQHINDLKNIMDEKITEILDEKSKVSFIINNLNTGVIVINNDGNIILVNKFILDINNTKEEDVLDKNYIYFIRNLEFQEKLEDTLDNGNINSFDIEAQKHTYLVSITPVMSKWTGNKDDKYGAFITITDLTEERNLEKIKREFFANASHELKSPLTTIIGYQQMILESIITTKDEILDASKRTVKEATRMHQIILEMLELARLESKEESKLEEINLKNIITELIDQYQNEINAKKINLNLRLDDLILFMNYSHLNQLVRNLVENAIKYNIESGNIEIVVNPKKFEFTIQDTGIGIKKEDQNRVFERFYRVDKARSKDQGGTGLGLSIVKHICNLYSAKVNLNSEIGKGTKITIQFMENKRDTQE